MQDWIGTMPTHSQKGLEIKYKDLFLNAFYSTLSENETILKVIEAECDKNSGREIKGLLVATNTRIHFISKKEKFDIDYKYINDINIKQDGKDKKEWLLTLSIGLNRRYFDDIRKDDDSQEFFEIIEKKVINPSQEILTTVTHDFKYFLHKEKLLELKSNNIQCTSFLLQRDDRGFSNNGKRLLEEKYPKALYIGEASYRDKTKKGNFIVLDKFVWLYEYKDKERVANKLLFWPLTFFTGATVDHFALKSEIITSDGKLVLDAFGKKFVSLLTYEGIKFSIKTRKWYNKILGYRSKKWWKMTIASASYGFLFLIILAMVFGEESKDTTASTSAKEVVTASKNSNESNDSDEKNKESIKDEKRKKAEVARLAEEKRKKAEAARIAEEKRKKVEAARIAEEKRKKVEAARIAEEKRKAEAARIAEEKRKAEAARIAAAKRDSSNNNSSTNKPAQTNVYYKNCSAARAAGAAPVHSGEPGYARHLDRDGDGVGCDS